MSALYCYINEKDLTRYHANQETLFFQIVSLVFKLQLTLFILLLTTLFLKSSFSYSEAKVISPIDLNHHDENQILGIVTTPSPTQIPTPTQFPTSIPTPTTCILPKKSYSIAIFGDSMIDTMGERLEYLEHSLKRKYPTTEFLLYNYGKGSENVAEGSTRIHSDFNYKDRHFPPLSQLRPDILIIGSFAYNPFSPYDRNKHWLTLAQFVEQARTIFPKVYLLAEIAPLKKDFGKGPGGVNWEEPTAYEHATHIIEQLENAVGLSKSLPVLLIDVFTPSQIGSEKEGVRKYVNSYDGIHPSIEGHEFTAEMIANSLTFE